MQLDNEWKDIAAKAWSIRLATLAGILGGVEAALPAFQSQVQVPDGTFAIMSTGVAFAAAIARVVAQKNLAK